MLEAALAAGLAAEGRARAHARRRARHPRWRGPRPDEGVAGAMISASHNRYPDNGIKLFAAGGRKLARRRREPRSRPSSTRSCTAATRCVDARRPATPSGTVAATPEHLLGYADSVVRVDRRPRPVRPAGRDRLRQRLGHDHRPARAAPARRRRHGDPRRPQRHQHQRGLRVDPPRRPAARRASTIAPTSGSRSTVTPTGCSRSTRTGALVDGDQIIAVCALDLHERGRLRNDTVVVTVMTNLGFRRAMTEHGITRRGDRGR